MTEVAHWIIACIIGKGVGGNSNFSTPLEHCIFTDKIRQDTTKFACFVFNNTGTFPHKFVKTWDKVFGSCEYDHHTVSRLSIDLTNELEDDQIWPVMLYCQCDCTMQIRLLYSSVYRIKKIFTENWISAYSTQITGQLGMKLRTDVGYVTYWSALNKNTQLRLKNDVFPCVFALIRQFLCGTCQRISHEAKWAGISYCEFALKCADGRNVFIISLLQKFEEGGIVQLEESFKLYNKL